MTLKELELAIVRVAEKWPDRRFYPKSVTQLNPWQACILGQIAADAGWPHIHADVFTDWSFKRAASPAHKLARAAQLLNDLGTPWGQIPIKLGLVPGEQPAQEPQSAIEPIEEKVHAAV